MRGNLFLVFVLFGSTFGQFEPDGSNMNVVVVKDQLPSFATLTLLNTQIAKPQPASAEILPWWAWLLIAIGCLAAVAGGVYLVVILCKPKEKKNEIKNIPTTAIVETLEEATRQREAFERIIRKNAEKARMPDLPKNFDKQQKLIYGCVTVEAMMFPYWQIKDRLLKRYPPRKGKEYEWFTETILEWFIYFNPCDAFPEEVVEDMPTPKGVTRIQDFYDENDLGKALDPGEVELFSCGPNELVYKFTKLWKDCKQTCLKWGMKKGEDGAYHMNRNIEENVVKNEGTGRQYRTFMFVQEY
uniref:Uncharacterized protein n=1 Tax=Panagrolaimus sp. JU765 TaxID=591449 RepID=A0AC34R0C9_9BILA